MTRLALVLSPADLPLAELCAARLDGELFRVDEGFAPVDVPGGPAQRAASLLPHCGSRFIVEQHSAAWVWGALDSPPARHELCASIGARARVAHPLRVSAREVMIDAADFVEVGGVRVTTPLRTITDLARFSDDYDAPLVARLCAIAGLSADDCAADLTARRNLPGKKRALTRLA